MAIFRHFIVTAVVFVYLSARDMSSRMTLGVNHLVYPLIPLDLSSINVLEGRINVLRPVSMLGWYVVSISAVRDNCCSPQANAAA